MFNPKSNLIFRSISESSGQFNRAYNSANNDAFSAVAHEAIFW